LEKSSRHTEEELRREYEVVKASMQDPQHFQVLYNRYYTPVFRFTWNRLTDKQLAADIVSDVFYKALLHLHKFRYQGVPFSAWLFRIAFNEVAQYYRKHKKQRVVSADETSIKNLWKEIQPDDNREKTDLLFTVLQLLEPAEMNLLELRIFEDRPFREVGEILGITENNAKVKFYRLVDKLKVLYKNKENS
jgi:RNA polymerase sigma-70 factor (ECF subfamily)